MTIETARSFFFWCTVINYAILVLWSVLAIVFRDGFYRLLCRFFRLSKDQFEMINIGGISIYKIGVLLLNLVPCVALYIVS
jgi:hypothetical protein